MLTNNFISIARKVKENEYTEFKVLTVLKITRLNPSGQYITKKRYT